MILVQALVGTISSIIGLYIWVVIIAALITWVNPDPSNQIVQILHKLTDPVYKKMKQYIPTVVGGVDIAPIILILALQFIQQLLYRI